MLGRVWVPLLLVLPSCFNPDESEDTGQDTSSSTATGSIDTATTSTPTTTSGSTASGSAGTTTTDGADDTTSTLDETSTTGDASTSAEPACAMDAICIERAPLGWEGPGIRRAERDNDPPPPCGGPFPDSIAVGFLDLEAPAAVCSCACDAPVGVGCSPVSVAAYADMACDDALGGGVLDVTCSSLGSGASSWNASQSLVNAGSCTPVPSTMLPPPVLSNARRVCAPDEAPACFGTPGSCVPAVPDAAYCIAREGDEPCPAGTAYQNREVLIGAADDSRGCSQCSCDPAEGVCPGTARVFSGSNCTGGQTEAPADGSCQASPSPQSGILLPGEPDAECPASGGMPLGTVVAESVTTICCMDPGP